MLGLGDGIKDDSEWPSGSTTMSDSGSRGSTMSSIGCTSSLPAFIPLVPATCSVCGISLLNDYGTRQKYQRHTKRAFRSESLDLFFFDRAAADLRCPAASPWYLR